MSTRIVSAAQWSDDCQGKKDYDGPLVSVSTRYWPRGGGFSTFDTATGEWTENDSRPHICPRAVSKIVLNLKDDDRTVLAVHEFQAESEADVKDQVESWVQGQFAEIVKSLEVLYGPAKNKNE